jgi:hypothetical protein
MKWILSVSLFYSSLLFSAGPDWVHSPEKFCKRSELCAVGEAGGFNLASANARREMAKIFQTQIKSTFTAKTVALNQDVYDEVSSEVNEMTDEILMGVEIKERFEDSDGVYALAVLDKMKTSTIFKDEISKLDEKMEVLFSDAGNHSVIMLKKYYEKRSLLNERYRFLTGGAIPEKISYKEIYNKIKKATEGKLIFVEFDGKASKDIEGLVVKFLTDMGFKVATSASPKVTHFVSGTYTSEKAYMNVPGFEKYKFLLNLYGKDSDGKKSGALQFETSTIGRDEQQAYDKSIPLLKSYLEEKLAELNIE